MEFSPTPKVHRLKRPLTILMVSLLFHVALDTTQTRADEAVFHKFLYNLIHAV